MAIIGFSLLCVSSVLTVVAQLSRTHFFMAASSTFTLAGLCLGSSLIILVSAVSDEFNSTSVSQVGDLTSNPFLFQAQKRRNNIVFVLYFEFIAL